ncbi:MAG: 5-oxoprolinase subunit PxpB [Armatimonadota bacterium]|nr:5-oxoprolinase subunit PxpB [Armatimonadota bacterium]MDR7452602.1 5-oxoprolinase subunit PxpB [Armatimonadota bacterium]MDR7468237.1 5-oxoprolinase subunit PxpB [Armatimonadota bacterium]MDR7495231.1 5-oxoprolinase subunit PxpB [Armatimonadota bacterium]MDR7500478.1 5-oxoprolinase subunit PxpB [Armatimonadota bacterium]
MNILPLGECAVLIELEDRLDPAVNGRVRALARHLRDLPGVEDVVPALRSVTVVFDPLTADPAVIAETAEQVLPGLTPQAGTTGRTFEVPVAYGGAAGPDLEETAASLGLSAEQFIRIHGGVEYTVFMLGFTPGFPYLGILPEEIRVPRLPVPRVRVPEGSVAVADAMTGIYPLTSAGGWRLIGRTPLAIYDPRQADPVLFRPGDRVRFIPAPPSPVPERPGPSPLPLPRRPVFEVRSAGLYTTVQDAGRRGYRHLGVPSSGAMDPLALWAANTAVGNPPGVPALEVTAPGPVLRVLEHTTVALAGADLSPRLDGAEIEQGVALFLRPGQTLEFGAPRRGMWTYVAVAGGVDATTALGSASTYVPGLLGGSGGRRLQDGDVIGAGPPPPTRRKVVPAEQVPLPAHSLTVRVIPGPQDEWLTEEGRGAFLKQEWRISPQRDRAGVRLEGVPLAHRRSGEFLSDGVIPGAIQVPSGGRPIIIMADGPTTGGYPKAAVVIAADLRLVAQAPPRAVLRFRPVTLEEALEALREQRARMGTRRAETAPEDRE